jgi:type II secretion system (T2SS) protein C
MPKMGNSRPWIWLASAGLTAAATYLVFALIRSSVVAEPNLAAGARQADLPTNPSPKFDPADALLGSDSSISTRQMQLILVATAPGGTPREGTATLGTDPRNPQTYAAGARLVNGAVIEEIYGDHIVLELNGTRSQLSIGQKSLFQRLSSKTRETDATTVGGSAVRQPLDTVASSREDLSEIIRPEPVFDAQGFAGLRILPGRYRHKLDALGLKAGDIVRTIDGKQLKSADAAWQLLDDSLSTGSSIVVSVEREGALTSMILDGSRIIESAVQVNSIEMMPGPPRS